MVSAAEIQKIISELTKCEKKILIEVGRLNLSTSKNNREETILKKLSDEDRKKCKKFIKTLLRKGLIFQYRPKNYGASRIGRLVAHTLEEEKIKERYNELSRILMVM